MTAIVGILVIGLVVSAICKIIAGAAKLATKGALLLFFPAAGASAFTAFDPSWIKGAMDTCHIDAATMHKLIQVIFGS